MAMATTERYGHTHTYTHSTLISIHGSYLATKVFICLLSTMGERGGSSADDKRGHGPTNVSERNWGKVETNQLGDAGTASHN